MTTHFHDLNCIEFANDVPCTLCLGGPTMYVGSVPDVESGPSLSDRPEPNALMHLCQRCSDSIDAISTQRRVWTPHSRRRRFTTATPPARAAGANRPE
jgi:hypothetical protein